MFTGGIVVAGARVDSVRIEGAADESAEDETAEYESAAVEDAGINGARASGIVAPLPEGRPQASSSSDKGCTSKFGAAGCDGATASASRFNLAIAMVDICKVELMSPTGAASGALPCDN